METAVKVQISGLAQRLAETCAAFLTLPDVLAGEIEAKNAGEAWRATPARGSFGVTLKRALKREPTDEELEYCMAEWRDVYGMAVARLS